MLSEAEARRFAADWLPAWTGNRPEHLAGFYSEDAFYCDPARPQGLRGRAALLAYFEHLLAKYPDWVWEQIEAFPMAGGFLNKWRVTLPRADAAIAIVGVCLVQLDGERRIRRNEVYFDPSALHRAS